jgi:hypothetical protein
VAVLQVPVAAAAAQGHHYLGRLTAQRPRQPKAHSSRSSSNQARKAVVSVKQAGKARHCKARQVS